MHDKKKEADDSFAELAQANLAKDQQLEIQKAYVEVIRRIGAPILKPGPAITRYRRRFTQGDDSLAARAIEVMRFVLVNPANFCLPCIERHGFAFHARPLNGLCNACGQSGLVWPGVRTDVNVMALLWGHLPDACDICSVPIFNLKTAVLNEVGGLACQRCRGSVDRLMRMAKRVGQVGQAMMQGAQEFKGNQGGAK